MTIECQPPAIGEIIHIRRVLSTVLRCNALPFAYLVSDVTVFAFVSAAAKFDFLKPTINNALIYICYVSTVL